MLLSKTGRVSSGPTKGANSRWPPQLDRSCICTLRCVLQVPRPEALFGFILDHLFYI